MSKVIAMPREESLICKHLIKEFKTLKPKTLFITAMASLEDEYKKRIKEKLSIMQDAGFEVCIYDLEKDKCYEDFLVDFKEAHMLHISGELIQHLSLWVQRTELDKFLQENPFEQSISSSGVGALLLTPIVEHMNCEKKNPNEFETLKSINILPLSLIFSTQINKESSSSLYYNLIFNDENALFLNNHSYVSMEKGKIKITDVKNSNT